MSAAEFWQQLPPTTKTALQAAGITSAAAIALRFPLRYENWESLHKISTLRANQKALVEGVIVDAQLRYWRGGRRQLVVQIEDDDDGLLTVRFFNVTPGMERAMDIGKRLRVLGTVKLGRGWEMAHPKIQFSQTQGKMQAVYPTLSGMSQEQQRRLVEKLLTTVILDETVPPDLRQFDGGKWTTQAAIHLIHRPPPDAHDTIEQLQNGEHVAWRRLRFDELLAHQILLRLRYRRRNRLRAPALNPPPQWNMPLYESLPFVPTNAQQKAIADVCSDLSKERPMRRLLQGDVGSGKTVVAAFACLSAAAAEHVAILMAPTEILARQHYDTLSAYFRSSNIHCELLTGAIKGAKRRDSLARLRLGISRVVIGTHALFYEEKNMPKAAVVIIDEQHRFGVEQRRALLASGTTHQLMMSATPIPRTLAMSAFADMDMSVLDELPPGRQPVKTLLVPCRRRNEVLARINTQKDGAAYWVCPRIEESDADDLQDVFSLLAQVSRDYPQLSPQVLHGRMSAAEKQTAIDFFRAGKTRFLAATTVIEVGVDVPQADVMVVDHAERMGLSQLHQLRGRVGRGGKEGVCILLYADDLSAEAKTRLKILRETVDGFAIAEMDLRLRGPGEWLGTKQSGLPMLRVAKLGEDSDLIAAAGKAAEWLLDNDRPAGARHVRRWLGGRKST